MDDPFGLTCFSCRVLFWKLVQSNLLLYFASLCFCTGAQLSTGFSEGVFQSSGAEWKMEKPREGAGGSREVGMQLDKSRGLWWRWWLVGDFDAIGMSSQAHEHRPNRT